MSASLGKIVSFSDKYLRTGEITDYPGAHNGLQVDNDGSVTKIAAAVDSHEGVLEEAARAGADLLVVHHGLFWKSPIPVTGTSYRRLKLCLDHNLAVYSSHLPLDMHPEIGNNVLLARSLGLEKLKPFCKLNGQTIGVRGEVNLDLSRLAERLKKSVSGEVRVIAGGSQKVRHVGVVTGGAGSEIPQAAQEGLDAFVTGEGSHPTFGTALEEGMNVLYGGHYATETFGVKALAALLSKKFRVPWLFIDIPSGL